MCPWCFLTPACPCRLGAEPSSLTLGKALVAVARRVGAVRLGFVALLLAVAVIALGGCGGNDDERGGQVRLAERAGHQIAEAGFPGAVGSEFAARAHKLNVRISAAQFDSEAFQGPRCARKRLTSPAHSGCL
jgi:hypothetical protein